MACRMENPTASEAKSANVLDRQSFPVVVGEIKKHIPVSDEQYGYLTSLFLLAYAIMYAGGGRIMDRLGTRLAERGRRCVRRDVAGHDRRVEARLELAHRVEHKARVAVRGVDE